MHEEWEQKVLQEDFNALRRARGVRDETGQKQEALQQIDSYYQHKIFEMQRLAQRKSALHLDEEVNEGAARHGGANL